MQVSGDGGSDCYSAAIVVARSLFLPEPHTHTHTHKRAASSVETTMDLFTIKAVFSTPCDVLVWPGGLGGRSQKAEGGGFTIHLIGSGPSSVGWGTGGHCKGRS